MGGPARSAPQAVAVVHAEQTDHLERDRAHRHQPAEGDAASAKAPVQTRCVQPGPPGLAQHRQRHRLIKIGPHTGGQSSAQRLDPGRQRTGHRCVQPADLAARLDAGRGCALAHRAAQQHAAHAKQPGVGLAAGAQAQAVAPAGAQAPAGCLRARAGRRYRTGCSANRRAPPGQTPSVWPARSWRCRAPSPPHHVAAAAAAARRRPGWAGQPAWPATGRAGSRPRAARCGLSARPRCGTPGSGCCSP